MQKILWAVAKGDPAWAEQVITEHAERIPEASKWAIENGFYNLRVAIIDDEKPDFTKCINI